MRDLRDYLRDVMPLDDEAFSDATGGADRAEMSELLARLETLLNDLDVLLDSPPPST